MTFDVENRFFSILSDDTVTLIYELLEYFQILNVYVDEDYF